MKFVNLHGHDGHSVYDAIGSPADYAEWMLKNAGDDSGALAITNHGNMNSIGYIAAAQKKYKDKVKFIFGVEAYYIPSLLDWNKAYQEKRDEKKKKESEFIIEDEEESKLKEYDILKRRHHLVLLAQNQEGLKNLFRLVTRSHREGFYRKPRIDFNMLQECNEGLIASTACLAGIPTWCSFHPSIDNFDPSVHPAYIMKLYKQELGPLMELFGKDRFFLELQFHNIKEQKIVNRHLCEFSKKTGYDLIVTCDAHYPNLEMWKDREIYKLLGYQMQSKGIDLSSLDRDSSELDAQLYLKNGDQVWESYQKVHKEELDEFDIKAAIKRTYDIAYDFIEGVTPDSTVKLPKIFQANEKVQLPFDRLKALTLQGLKDKGLTQKEYIDRAAFELNVIKKIGVEEYFLVKREILDVLKKHMLLGPARGSAGGSLVCYLIGITLMDPIRDGLLFERFMSSARVEIPDIDSDVELKEQTLDILKDYFGEKNVIAISNYNRLQLKSLIKDVAKLYGVSYDEVNTVTKVMENEARDAIMEEIGHDQKLYEFTFEKAKQHSPTFKKFLTTYPDVGLHITNLFKEIRSIGRHAGGVLVVPDAESCLPIVKSKGVEQSPITEGITAQHLSYFGLIKFDVLGLATLRIIRRCIEAILNSQDIKEPTIEQIYEFYNTKLHPDVINKIDSKVFKNVYRKGQWPSIFQFAEGGIQNFCRQAEPSSVDDISAISAIWRPGPLKGKANERYVASRPSDVEKEHPIIQQVLGDTRGLLIYQEQFMLLAHKLAGFSLEEANKLRKLLVKPATSLAEEMKKERIEIGKKFVNGCIEKGLDSKRAEILWEKEILGFISYGFNKSHSQAYAYNSYQCAWLFTYYPEQWIKACLECDPDFEKTINVVRQLGFVVKKPDVSFSQTDRWSVNSNSCIPSLISVKGIGVTAANELVKNRPAGGFKNMKDFFFNDGRWRWSKLNRKALDALIKVEAFDSIKDSTFKNYKHMHESLFGNVDVVKKNRKTKESETVQVCAFDLIKDGKLSLEDAAFHASSDDWTIAEKLIIQKEIIGFYNKNLIVEEYLDTFKEFKIKAVDETPDKQGKKHVWGIVEDVKQKITKTKKPYLVVTVSGMSDKSYTFKVWDTAIEEKSIWKDGSVVVFTLDYDKKYGFNLNRNTSVMKVNK